MSAIGTQCATADSPVEIVEHGAIFGANIYFDLGTKGAKEVRYNPSGRTEALKITELATGRHTVEVRNVRTGFPQSARYQVLEGKTVVWSTAILHDHPTGLEIKDGQRLRITILEPGEPYDGKFFTFKGVPCALIFTRPYWYQDAQGEWKGKEDFPNSLFFLADREKWGHEKVLRELARFMATKVRDKDHDAPDNYRSVCHVGVQIALTAEGKIPAILTETPAEKLEEELFVAFTKAYERFLAESCYRPMFKDQEGRVVHVTLRQGIEQAAPLLAEWKKKNPNWNKKEK